MNYTGNENVDSRAIYIEKRNRAIIEAKTLPQLILFGDSITEGFSPLNYGIISKQVLNCGIGGERISTAIARLERDVLNFNPKQVHIMLGINDLLHFPQIDPDQIEAETDRLISNYTQILDILRNASIELYCAGIIKLSEIAYNEQTHVFLNYMYYNAIIDKLNQKIKAYCEINEIKYIDYNEVLTNKYNQLNVTYTYDGIHLNEKGYFELFKVMRKEGVL